MTQKRIAVYDPEFRELGHNTWFNIHVVRMLSSLFKEVYYFDSNKIVEKNFTDIPGNVKIVQLPSHLINIGEVTVNNNGKLGRKAYKKIYKILNLIKSKFTANPAGEGSNFYNDLWEFIDKYHCNLLFLTAEGTRYRKYLYTSFPKIPYILLIHVVWSVLKTSYNKSIGGNVRDFLERAECIFVMEDFLIPPLAGSNKNIFRFPLYVYEDDHTIPRKTDILPLKIGTVGVINEGRNVDFILETLISYSEETLEYYLYGKPLGKVGATVINIANRNIFPANVKLFTHFEYLDEEEYDSIVKKCDFVIIAYDEKRKYQASGGMYRFINNFTPLIVPRIEPFVTIEKSYENIFLFYDDLSTGSLIDLLGVLAKKGKEYKDYKRKAAIAMEKYIAFNKRRKQVEHLGRILETLAAN